MRELFLLPEVQSFATFTAFAAEHQIGATDLIITNKPILPNFQAEIPAGVPVICTEDYGLGEPSDVMFEAIQADAAQYDYKRVVAVGGGTAIDIAKALCAAEGRDMDALFDEDPAALQHTKTLFCLPTTCGTGSEVTNLSILALISLNTKKGLGAPCMFGDKAVLVPELLKTLPLSVFATSSIDALIHSIESSLSPKANPITELFGYKAIEIILKGYMEIRDKGPEARIPLLKDFLLASTYGGIAFGNAGCAAVHALSYPLGAAYHVPHGESNYAMFTGVMKKYMSIRTDGAIAKLNAYMAGILGCDVDKVYEALEDLLNTLLPKKALHEYGMKESELEEFTDSVIANQQRLLNNNFVPLSRQDILDIYTSLY